MTATYMYMHFWPMGDRYWQIPLYIVHIKIADMGISQTMTPGGVMGFKGSPGFMAPEILKYVGLEACTEKVDIFSYAMFLYEMISLYFPFEKQNLMKAQIEKLVTEEERPSLQSRVSPYIIANTVNV